MMMIWEDCWPIEPESMEESSWFDELSIDVSTQSKISVWAYAKKRLDWMLCAQRDFKIF